MPAVDSSSHQVRSPLAWSPGQEGDQEEKVGGADHTEVRSQHHRTSVLRCGHGSGGVPVVVFKGQQCVMCARVHVSVPMQMGVGAFQERQWLSGAGVSRLSCLLWERLSERTSVLVTGD